MVKGGGLKLDINIPPQHILAKSKGGLIIEGGVSSSEYGTYAHYMDGSRFSSQGCCLTVV